ncbi:MAG: hypothetical protein COV66_10175 [Nitrospinae bacterium CG11_big_fil_rev_8_21_14_0_20_45_15]|nr:MAG: hypothetical protein COV66_10175 [Nitrospinae bacterium CG11_big_fil_rev_8_21_14_0_20_45_15]
MEDLVKSEEAGQNMWSPKPKSREHVEELLRRQNINTFVEIYGKDVFKKFRKNRVPISKRT